MSTVSSSFVEKTIAQAPQTLAPDELYDALGIDQHNACQLDQPFNDADYLQLLRRIAASEPENISFHIRFGASVSCDDLDVLGLAWKCARSLRDGFHRTARHNQVLQKTWTVEAQPSAAQTVILLHTTRAAFDTAYALYTEAVLALLIAICREVSVRTFKPRYILCQHDVLGDRQFLESYLQCPVISNAETTAIVATNEDLDMPIQTTKRFVSDIFNPHLSLPDAEDRDAANFEARIRSEISMALSAGPPNISKISKSLGVSNHALNRHLVEQNTSFKTLAEETRCNFVKRLSQSRNYSFPQVAFLAGFKTEPAFERALKRWDIKYS